MTPSTVVCLFDDSGNLFDDWLSAGYKVMCVDLAPLSQRVTRPGVEHVVADLRLPLALPVDDGQVVFVSAHPPCDHLAVSGARWWKGKGLRALADSIHMFATAADYCEKSGAPYTIENPVSGVSSHWRSPDFIYSPWQYSGFDERDYYTKKTCLWVGGGFVMPPPFYDEARYAKGVAQRKAVLAKHGRKRAAQAVQDEQPDYPDSRIFNAGGRAKAYARSVTPKGFGRAVFLSNCSAANTVDDHYRKPQNALPRNPEEVERSSDCTRPVEGASAEGASAAVASAEQPHRLFEDLV